MWRRFASTADEFIVAYSTPPVLVPVKLFEIGHAVELYLKASYISMTGDVDKAMTFGHGIARILSACKAIDPSFMARYDLRVETFFADLRCYLKHPEPNCFDVLAHHLSQSALPPSSRHFLSSIARKQ